MFALVEKKNIEEISFKAEEMIYEGHLQPNVETARLPPWLGPGAALRKGFCQDESLLRCDCGFKGTRQSQACGVQRRMHWRQQRF